MLKGQGKKFRSLWSLGNLAPVSVILALMLVCFRGVALHLQTKWEPIPYIRALSAPLLPLPTFDKVPVGDYDLEERPVKPELVGIIAPRLALIARNHPDPKVGKDLVSNLDKKQLAIWYARDKDNPISPASFMLMDSENFLGVHISPRKYIPVIRIDTFPLFYWEEDDIRMLLTALAHEFAHYESYMRSGEEQKKMFRSDLSSREVSAEFMWYEELNAYKTQCHSVLTYGLVQTSRVPYCWSVNEPKAFARELFMYHVKQGGMRYSWRSRWAKLAGHPYWWAYLWP